MILSATDCAARAGPGRVGVKSRGGRGRPGGVSASKRGVGARLARDAVCREIHGGEGAGAEQLLGDLRGQGEDALAESGAGWAMHSFKNTRTPVRAFAPRGETTRPPRGRGAGARNLEAVGHVVMDRVLPEQKAPATEGAPEGGARRGAVRRWQRACEHSACPRLAPRAGPSHHPRPAAPPPPRAAFGSAQSTLPATALSIAILCLKGGGGGGEREREREREIDR